MSVLQAPRLVDVSVKHFTTRFPWLRTFVLGVLLAISLVISFSLKNVTPLNPNSAAPLTPFLQVWAILFLPYAAACALIFLSVPTRGRWRWFEICLILLSPLLLRATLLPLPPNLPHNPSRYSC